MYGTYWFIHHLCNITIVLSDLESKDIFPHNNAQHCPFLHKSLGPFNPITSSIFPRKASCIISHSFLCRPSGSYAERGRASRETREMDSVIAKDSRMEAVTNVFRWHSCCDPAMNICSERKYLCALYCTRDEARPVLMQNPFENRGGEKTSRRAALRRAAMKR